MTTNLQLSSEEVCPFEAKLMQIQMRLVTFTIELENEQLFDIQKEEQFLIKYVSSILEGQLKPLLKSISDGAMPQGIYLWEEITNLVKIWISMIGGLKKSKANISNCASLPEAYPSTFAIIQLTCDHIALLKKIMNNDKSQNFKKDENSEEKGATYIKNSYGPVHAEQIDQMQAADSITDSQMVQAGEAKIFNKSNVPAELQKEFSEMKESMENSTTKEEKQSWWIKLSKWSRKHKDKLGKAATEVEDWIDGIDPSAL